MTKKKVEEIIKKMETFFPNAKCELNFRTWFQLLVSVILSAQTTDKQVNKVTKTLFRTIQNPQDVLNLWQDKLAQEVKSIWLYRTKSKNIYATSKILIEKFDTKIPNRMEKLITLPWVGEKTAKVILSVLYNQPYIAVDTHVHRIANRLGIVNTKTPLQTSKKIEKLVPQKLKNKAHHLFIFWWRYFCTARNPKCKECPFIDFCKFYRK